MHQFKSYNTSHSYVWCYVSARDVSCCLTHVTHSYVWRYYNIYITWHDSFICVTIQRDATARDVSCCLSHVTHSYVWRYMCVRERWDAPYQHEMCRVVNPPTFILLDMTHSYVWRYNVMLQHEMRRVVNPAAFTLLDMCDMTHSCVWSYSHYLIGVTWLIHVCDETPWCDIMRSAVLSVLQHDSATLVWSYLTRLYVWYYKMTHW